MSARPSAKPTALVCLLPGLGDAMTASNVLRRLDASGYDVDVMTMLHPVAEYASALDVVRTVYQIPLLARPWSCIPAVFDLRVRRYDLCVVPFPATRWQYSFVALLVGARQNLIHNYGGTSAIIGRVARSTQVNLSGGHRIWENERLCDAAGLSSDPESGYLVPSSWRLPRIPNLLGVHTGTMIYKGNEARRWPFERFIDVIRMQPAERAVRIFIGPNEAEDEERLRRALPGHNIEIIKAPLQEAGRALSECEVFLGNDAGFSHLASGLGVKTLVVFGMTNPVRALPIGDAVAVRPTQCPPCHDEGLHGFTCVRSIGFRCLLEDLPASLVNDQIDDLFDSNIVSQRIEPSGTYFLYGRQHAPA